ncbi:MAG: hypothetical protein PHP93_08685 [Kiritimatiellales bacterium]|nr:hypothetical protein [Kiritimatiellales bacterium]
MKNFIKVAVLSALLATVFGCASGTYETRLDPPDAFNPIFMQYKDLPGQKIMVIAVDLTGQWAFGYDGGRATLEEAAENAAIKCDKARDKHQVFTTAKLFAVNDEIVYYKNQFE